MNTSTLWQTLTSPSGTFNEVVDVVTATLTDIDKGTKP